MTPLDIISRSYRMLGVLGQGNPTPNPYQSQVAITVLNNLLLSWSRKRLVIPARQWFTFQLTSGKQNYTMGVKTATVTPDFCTDTEASNQVVYRPTQIEQAGVILPNSPPGQPFELPMAVWTDAQWAVESLKKLTGTQIFPMAVWPSGGYPLQTLWMWPVPMAPASVSLYCTQPLAQVIGNAALIADLDLPDGYEDALAFNLAVNLAPECNKEPSEVVAKRAVETLQDIKNSNLQPIFLRCDSGISQNLYPGAGGSAYNYLTDNY